MPEAHGPLRARVQIALAAGLLAACVNACAAAPAKASDTFPIDAWAGASLADTAYLLAPGDKIEVIVHTAPELSRELVVAPDGRIRMPLAGSVMAMAMTPDELAEILRDALASELIDPDLDVVTTEFASQKVFVGGEVREPGMFDLPGQIDPFQAIVMAGGLTRDAQPKDVILIRRLPGGEVRSALIDVRSGLRDPAFAGWLPLRRFDIIYVPRTRISEQNQFVQQYIRDALPVQFSLFYDVSGNNR
ncbi:MAG: polysaccharide export protein [Acidobacteria bacterium]|nr:polysaccharide export protein [Acidobacteriota bacterium]